MENTPFVPLVSERVAKKQMIEICQRLYHKDWLAACDGNVSVRLRDDRILITPGGRHKGFITEDDLAIVDINNKVIKGNPSTERLMHLEVYKFLPQAKSVVHAHPPNAVAWTIAQPQLRELPFRSAPEAILAVGKIPIVPYARPGTQEMGTYLQEYLDEHKAMVLSHHGSLCWGENLEEAFNATERLEHISKTLRYALQLGGLAELPADEIDALLKKRETLGNTVL